MSERPELPSGKCTWVKNSMLGIYDDCGNLPCRQLVRSGCRLQLRPEFCRTVLENPFTRRGLVQPHPGLRTDLEHVCKIQLALSGSKEVALLPVTVSVRELGSRSSEEGWAYMQEPVCDQGHRQYLQAQVGQCQTRLLCSVACFEVHEICRFGGVSKEWHCQPWDWRLGFPKVVLKLQDPGALLTPGCLLQLCYG